ncbi:MAG: SBBP repeat-containing protein [Candidatus Thorarchaeota archaeon]
METNIYKEMNFYTEKYDENIKTSSSSYYLDWFDIWGGSEQEYLYSGVATDSNGFIYVAGDTYSFGSGGYDIFVIKYDLYGNKIWTRFWGTSTHENVNDITVDSSGDIYITGYQGSSGYDMLILKYDSNGNYQWHSIWGPGTFNEGYGVVVNGSGDVYIAGRADGDFALLKYNSAGIFLWSKINRSLPGPDDIVIGKSGFLYICGKQDYINKYIAKYNSNGMLIWNHLWTDENIVDVNAMALDNNSNFYLTGTIQINDTSNRDAYIVKFNSSGSILWKFLWGNPIYENDTIYETGKGIAIDDFGNIYIVGETDTPYKNSDTFILKLNSYGDQLWNKTWGGLQSDYGCGLTLDMYGDVYISGTTNSYGAGNSDIFILKYSPCIPPRMFNLISNAGLPDYDGTFDIIWTSSLANNFSIYIFDNFSTDINNYRSLLEYETAKSPYRFNSLSSGSYYFIIEAKNDYGTTLSNCIEVIVQISSFPYLITFLIILICLNIIAIPLIIYLILNKFKSGKAV